MFLSGRNPAEYARAIEQLPRTVNRAAQFHLPLLREVEFAIRKKQQMRLKQERIAQINMAADEIVEDAGLEEDDVPSTPTVARRKSKKKAA